VALVDGLWTDADENEALLLEYQSYALTLEWQRLTTDPDDPEVQERRAAAEAAGIKPPPVPLVTPMARRPWRHQVRRFEEFADQVAPYTPAEPEPDPDLESLDTGAFLSAWVGTHFG
jgi:hypothetical protein